MTLGTKPLDISEHLNTPDEIRAFLQEVLETGEESDFIHALSIAAKATGMTKVTKKAGVTRASLYKSLAENGNLKFSTVSKTAETLGCSLQIPF